MTADIIEAAARALADCGFSDSEYRAVARITIAAVTPLIEDAYVRSRATIHVAAIRAAALERAAKLVASSAVRGASDLAADIRALKEQP